MKTQAELLKFLEPLPEQVGGTSCDDGIPARRATEDLEAQILAAHATRILALDVRQIGRPAVLFECLEHPEWGKLTARDMATKLDVVNSRIWNGDKYRTRIKGLRIVRRGEAWGAAPARTPALPRSKKTDRCTKHRPVISDRYGWFPSSSQASKHLGFTPSAVAVSIYKELLCGGAHWRWATPAEGITNGQPVRAVTQIADVPQPVRKRRAPAGRAA